MGKIMTLILVIVCLGGCKKEKIEHYGLISGKVEEIEVPSVWQGHPIKKALLSKTLETQLELPDGSYVMFEGQLGLGIESRNYFVLEGTSQFLVAKAEGRFVVHTRAGEVEAIGTDFLVKAQEVPPKAQGLNVGENGAQLMLQVNQGQVKVKAPGNNNPQIVAAGNKVILMLGEVRREGEIQAVGLGLSTKKGKIGEIMKKRASKTDALKNLGELGSGMEFLATFSQEQFAFKSAQFMGNYVIQENRILSTEHRPLDEEVMLCIVRAKIEHQESVARRNCKTYKGQAGTPVGLHENPAMAIVSAKNNAILSVVKQAAEEFYGASFPSELSGVFYPLSYQVEKKDQHYIAQVTGEVLFK